MELPPTAMPVSDALMMASSPVVAPAVPPPPPAAALPTAATVPVAMPASSGHDRANFCASVYFLGGPRSAVPSDSTSHGPAKTQARRCFLAQHVYGGFVPCAGECVVAQLPQSLALDSNLDAIGVIRSVSSWSRRKSSGGKNLTVVHRGATISDVLRLIGSIAALSALPSDAAARLVVAASDDLRRPYVTGRVWKAGPLPLGGCTGPLVFVELSPEVPTTGAARDACLSQVRRAVASHVVASVDPDGVCFVASRN